MGVRAEYIRGQALETLLYLETIIADHESRIAALEGPPLVGDLNKQEKEEDNGKRHASGERVRHRS